MESEFVTYNKVPIRVDSWGGYLPSKILDRLQEKPKELILVIPGNPGVTKFYKKFLTLVHEKTNKPIWILSHGGHDKLNEKLPPLKQNKHLYNLQGQVEQKNWLIETYLQGVNLYMIGHSIGCKMILELLKKERKCNIDIEKCIMLFPTLERMAETRNGASVIFVINYILWLTLFLSWVFTCLPHILRVSLIRVFCIVARFPTSSIPALLELVDPHVLNKVFYLADDEMKNVKQLDDDVLKIHGNKLTLYYGASDGWTPLKYYEELKAKHENVNASVCPLQHEFVLKQSEEVSKLVHSWLTS